MVPALTFAELPATVERLLAGGSGGLPVAGRFERVGLVLLDAFGRRFAERHAAHPLLRRLTRDGQVVELSTQFPSTTTAHVSTIHTGLPVGEHGLYEWNVYEPALDAVITPILFSWAGARRRDTLRGSGLEMADLLPAETLYRRLERHGVRSVVLQPAAFSPSTFDSVATAGAELRPYDRFADGARMLAEALREPGGPRYAYLYWDGIDAVGHRCGPDSPEFEAACVSALDTLERELLGPAARPAASTLLLITADHGQVTVAPERTDELERFLPELAGYLRAGAGGRPLRPAGSARDVFLHAAPGRAEALAAALGERMDGRAEVRLTADLLAGGAFGAAGPRLRERLGDVCVLPGPGRMAWLASARDQQQAFRGHHGGLSAAETEIWLGALALG